MATQYIQKGTENELVTTLLEAGEIDGKVLLLVLMHISSNKLAGCIVQDSSDYPARYNSLQVVEKTAPNPLAGELEIQEGECQYRVWALTEEEAEAIDWQGIAESNHDTLPQIPPLEWGLLIVKGDTPEKVEHTPQKRWRTVYQEQQ